MTVSSLILLLTINSIDAGVSFGPIFPTGQLTKSYNVTTVGSLFGSINNFECAYHFSKFNGKISNQDYLYLHTGTISYQYPFYQKELQTLNAILGVSYNRIIRKFQLAKETGYAFGMNYGIGYKKYFTGTEFLDRWQPALLTQICLNQIIQSRNWNSVQRIASSYLFSIQIGLSFHLR